MRSCGIKRTPPRSLKTKEDRKKNFLLPKSKNYPRAKTKSSLLVEAYPLC